MKHLGGKKKKKTPQKGKVVTSHKKFWDSICSDKKKITQENNSSENWELSNICIEPKPVEMHWGQQIFYYLRNLYAAQKNRLSVLHNVHIVVVCCEPFKKYECLNKRKDRNLPYKANILAKN